MGTVTVSRKKRSKATKSVLAIVLALLLALGGTFAWVSAQSVDNELSSEALKNPGGRLHDDFIWTSDQKNKDVYVENFTSASNGESIFARVQLRECLEKEVGGVAKTFPEGANMSDKATWGVYDHTAPNTDIHSNFELKFGGKTKYMPTFNKDKDSTEADVNGSYRNADGQVINYSNYVDHAKVTSVTAEEKLGGGSTSPNVVHNAKDTLESSIKLMTDWTAEGCQPGPFWVYDNTEGTDANGGWFYWAQAITPDTATGLLLDNVELLAGTIEGDWDYQINVTGEFVTAEEPTVVTDEGTGAKTYYLDQAKTKTLSKNAYSLLRYVSDVQGIDVQAILDVPTASTAPSSPTESEVTLEGNSYYKLAQDGTKVMLLTKDLVSSPLYYVPGNSAAGPFGSYDNSWKSRTCRARTWCNDSYLSSLPYFTRTHIVDTSYYTRQQPLSTSYPETTSKVFLLSEADVFGTSSGSATVDPRCYTYNELLVPEGIRTAKLNGTDPGSWWLRSPHTYDHYVAYVNNDGNIQSTAYSESRYMRPAFWIDLGPLD